MAKVTVFGFSRQHPGKQIIDIGDNVVLVKDKDNEKDPDAIKVLTEDEKYQVGWVGNAPHTVVKGTKSASDVRHFFQDKIVGKVIEKTSVTFKNGHVSEAFKVEFRKEREEEMKKVKKITFKLVGSKSQYPCKFERLIPDFLDGKEPYIKLYVKDELIVGEHNGQLCGHVSKEKDKSLSEFDDVLQAVGDGRVAKVTKVSGTKIIGEFSIDEKEIEKQKNIITLKSVIENIVAQGIDTQENIDTKIEYMKKWWVTEKQMLNLFKTYVAYPKEVQDMIPEQPKTLFEDTEKEMLVQSSIAYINENRNLMYRGEKGTGKNVLATTIAWLYNRPLFELSLNSQYDNTTIFGGKVIAVDDNGNNVVVFDPEDAVKAGEYGGILVLDEINTALGHVLSVFNSPLDERRRFNVPGYKSFKAHPNFFAIGTMNEGYQTTFELNEATEERFVPLDFPMPKTIIPVLLAHFPDFEFAVLQKCDMVYKGMLKCVRDGELDERSLTVRGFIDACKGYRQDLPLKRALIHNVAQRCRYTDDRASVKNMIEDILG